MKLVIQYLIGEDYSWSVLETVPVEYESPEALLVDFEAAYKKAVETRTTLHSIIANMSLENIEDAQRHLRIRNEMDPNGDIQVGIFKVAGISSFEADDFNEEMPEIYTIEEWFALPR